MGTPHLFDVTVRGVALLDKGLTEGQATSGTGLLTNGLVWPCHANWYGPITSLGATLVTTSWTGLTLVSTSWAFAGVTISTSWTAASTNNIEEC